MIHTPKDSPMKLMFFADSQDFGNAHVTDSQHENITVVRQGPYWNTGMNTFRGWFPSTCYARFTMPVSVDIGVRTIQEGYIVNPQQIRRLVELYYSHCVKCIERRTEERERATEQAARRQSLQEEPSTAESFDAQLAANEFDEDYPPL